MKPTRQQQDVLDIINAFFQAKYGSQKSQEMLSIFVSAVAGAGKTSLIMMIIEALAEIERQYHVTIEQASLSFNKVIANTINNRLEKRSLRKIAKTTNSLGRSILVEAANQKQIRPLGKLDKNKFYYYDRKRNEISGLIADYCRRYANQIPILDTKNPFRLTPAGLASQINKLVSAARQTYAYPATEESLRKIVLHYDTGVDLLSPYWSFIWTSVNPIIQSGIDAFQDTGLHDFDDQVFLPLALEVAVPLYDFIATDEAQDLNKVRTELVKRAIKPNGVMIFVGDRRQAIQGFAYADTESVDNIIGDTHALEFPLTCCWRCDKNIIALAKVINPAIEARTDAPDGKLAIVEKGHYVKDLQAGYYHPAEKDLNKEADMVLCRTNAPLVAECLKAIRAGIFARVRGRDIGVNILRKLDDVLHFSPMTIEVADLVTEAEDYFTVEAAKINKGGRRDSEEEVDKLRDEIDTITTMIEGYLMTDPEEPSIDDLKTFIETKFEGEEADEQDQKEGPRPVLFSTIHKAKGLETDTVYIIEPQLLPHPAAVKKAELPETPAWQLEQEYNLLYVAVTRPKQKLCFVGSVPERLRATFETLTGVEEEDEPALLNRRGLFSQEAPHYDYDLEEEEEEVEMPPVEIPLSAQTVIEEASAPEPIVDAPVELPEQAEEEPALVQPTCSPKVQSSGRPRKGTVHQDVTLNYDELVEFDALPSEKKYTLSEYLQELMARDRADGWTIAKEVKARPLARPVGKKERIKKGRPEQKEDIETQAEEEIEPLEELPELETALVLSTRRLFFKCKSVVSPYGQPQVKCGHRWGHDYYYDAATRESFRFDEQGNCLTPELDRQPCRKCGKQYVSILNKGKGIEAKHNEGKDCNYSCQNASSDECECVCGGAGHGEKLIIGRKIYQGAKPEKKPDELLAAYNATPGEHTVEGFKDFAKAFYGGSPSPDTPSYTPPARPDAKDFAEEQGAAPTPQGNNKIIPFLRKALREQGERN